MNSNQSDAWLRPGRFAVVLAACIFAAYPDVVLGARTFFFRDFGLFGYPLAYHHRESIWSGEIPLWNPLNNCGMPFLAQWNTLVLYPGSLFYLLFPLSWSLAVFCLCHQFLAGLGMYFLAREWTGNRLAAAVAGMAFAFNGLTLNCLMWPNNIAGLGWMPWVVLCVEQAWRLGRRKVPGAATVAALQLLSGAPEIIFLTWTMLLVLLLEKLARPAAPRLALASRFSLTLSLALSLAAAQLFPFLDLLAHSQRGVDYSDSAWSMPGTGWANFLVPLFHCRLSNEGVFFQEGQWWTSSYYLGIGPLALAIYAALRSRSPRVHILAALAALSLILALGDNGRLYTWLKQAVPAFGFFRFPIKLVVLAIFCFALLAAQAIHSLQLRAWREQKFERLVLGMTWFALLTMIGGIIWFAHNHPVQPYEWLVARRNAAERAFFLSVFLGVLLVEHQAARQMSRRGLQLLPLLVMWLDVMTHAPRQNPTLPATAYEPGLVRLAPMPRHGIGRAMVSPGANAVFYGTSLTNALASYLSERAGLVTDCNLLEDISKLDGFFSLYLKEANQVWALLYDSGNTNRSRLLDFLNVSHTTVPGKLFDWETRTDFLPFVTAGLRPVFTDGTTALGSMAAPDFDPREVVYLPEEARSSVAAARTAARVVPITFSAQHDEIIVEAPAPAIVVVSQTYSPGWRAYVDGRPARLWRANYAFQAVETPAGRHRLEILYRDQWFFFGVIGSIAGLAAACLATWFRAAKRRFNS